MEVKSHIDYVDGAFSVMTGLTVLDNVIGGEAGVVDSGQSSSNLHVDNSRDSGY